MIESCPGGHKYFSGKGSVGQGVVEVIASAAGGRAAETGRIARGTIGRVHFQSPGLAFAASWERGTGLWRFRPVPAQHRLPASKSSNRLFPGSLPRVVAAPREAPLELSV